MNPQIIIAIHNVNYITLTAPAQVCPALILKCVSKILEYAISGGAAPFLRHKARLSAAKPSGFFLELTQNPLELANCSA